MPHGLLYDYMGQQRRFDKIIWALITAVGHAAINYCSSCIVEARKQKSWQILPHVKTAIFVKYDILTEYLTLFWFAMLVNEYKLYVSIQESSKDAKFGQCLYLGVPFVMSRTDAQNGVDIIFN
jgi:hypothetical protein